MDSGFVRCGACPDMEHLCPSCAHNLKLVRSQYDEIRSLKSRLELAGKAVKTPAVSGALRFREKTPFGSMHMTVVVDCKQDRAIEVFAQIGHTGDMVHADLEAICRLSSRLLRSGHGIKDVIKQVKGIGTNMATTEDAASIPNSFGLALGRYLKAVEKHGHKALLLGEVQVDEEELDSV